MKPKEFTEAYMPEMMATLGELIAIPSIFDEQSVTVGKPFGTKIAEALGLISQKAASIGMRVKNYDGYAGEFTIGSEDKMIGILSHIDVVSAGEGWSCEPFRARVIDGKIYGRGSSDDKGPTVAALYAVKYLLDEGLLPAGTGIRMIIGADEEEDWRCITHYLAKADKLPQYAIVPDANFPLINCEKGLIDADFSYSCIQDNAEERTQERDIYVEKLEGGIAKNVVPGKAYCILRCSNEKIAETIKQKIAEFDRVSVKIEGKLVQIEVMGKSTHAMSPEKGINAVSALMQILGHLEAEFSMDPVAEKYNRYIGMHYYGEALGCEFEDEVSGKLTFNVGTLSYRDGTIKFGASIRYPATLCMDSVLERLTEQCKKAVIKISVCSKMAGLYIDAHTEFIQRLMDAYHKNSKDENAEPLAIGGATYARAIPNAVAFGPLFPYEEELAHEADEYLAIDSLEKMTLIYIEALQSLLHMVAEED